MKPTGSKRREVVNVTKRVEDTKREIEQLKQDLQKLISKGIEINQSDGNVVAATVVNTPAKEIAAEEITRHEPVQCTSNAHPKLHIVSCSPNLTPAARLKAPNEQPSVAASVNSNACKPIRKYNVVDTRLYMQKQREKRMEQQRFRNNADKVRQDTRKQKLQELHNRTLQLVAKNVRQKRHSVTSSSGSFVRMDKKFSTLKECYQTDAANIRHANLKPAKAVTFIATHDSVPMETIESASVANSLVETNEKILCGSTADNNNDRDITNCNKQMINCEIQTENEVREEAENKVTDTARGWLKPTVVMPHSLNFINVVKRKFQLILEDEQKRTAVVIQAPPHESVAANTKCTVNLSKPHVNNNVNVQLANNVELLPSPAVTMVESSSELDTSRNVPDLSIESEIPISCETERASSQKNHSNVTEVEASVVNQLQSPHSLTTVLDHSKNLTVTKPNNNKEQRIQSDGNHSHLSICTRSLSYSSDFEDSGTHQNHTDVIQKSSEIRTDTKSVSTRNNTTSSNDVNVNTESHTLQKDNISLSTIVSESIHQDSLLTSTVHPSVSNQTNAIVNKDSSKNLNIRQLPENPNEIHVKFEAKVHLLSDGANQCAANIDSLRRLSDSKTVTKNVPTVLHNAITQTSFERKSYGFADNSTNINFSRGDESWMNAEDFLNDTPRHLDSLLSATLDVSHFSSSLMSTMSDSKLDSSGIYDENVTHFHCKNLSLKMLDNLIQDEEVRIDNLRTIVKIRERALLDRTKGELTWLELQRKHLLETGRLEEASLMKKKQRGILLKHEQERSEMKKLRQAQRHASQKRRKILKHQRNLIKTNLLSKAMTESVKVSNLRESRYSGPLRVIQLDDSMDTTRMKSGEVKHDIRMNEHSLKRKLLMKQTALQKRRRTAETLLQWNRKLLDEERRIVELEAAANAIASHDSQTFQSIRKQRFTGVELNKLWNTMTNRNDKKFAEDKTYRMSSEALQKLYEYTKYYNTPTTSNEGELNKKNLDERRAATFTAEQIVDKPPESVSLLLNESLQHSVDSHQNHYSSEFEVDDEDDVNKCTTVDNDQQLLSLSKLIDTLSQIKEEISEIGKKSETITTEIAASNEDGYVESVKSSTTLSDITEIQGNSSNESVSEANANRDQSESNKDADAVTETVLELSHIEHHPALNSADSTEVAFKLHEDGSAQEDSISKDGTNALSETHTLITSYSDNFDNNYDGTAATTKSSDLEGNSTGRSENSASDNASVSAPHVDDEEQPNDDVSQKTVTSEESVINFDSASNNGETSTTSSTARSDVKKSVNEILADVPAKTDKAQKGQDINVVAYGVDVSEYQQESHTTENDDFASDDIFGEEAELLKKQVAIELEIKELEEAQKDDPFYMFARDIPNKPPPPYTAPIVLSPSISSISPISANQIDAMVAFSATALFDAYHSHTLDGETFENLPVAYNTNNNKNTDSISMDKQCCTFVFNICKELTVDYFTQFTKRRLIRMHRIKECAKDEKTLADYLSTRLGELFGFREVHVNQSAVVRWSRKKRDSVDEILIREAQDEESHWINFDADEVIVKDRVTNEILKMLLKETGVLFQNILSTRHTNLCKT